MTDIFISYRRSGFFLTALQLREALISIIGEDRVCLNRGSVPPGLDIFEFVAGTLRDTKVLLVLIEPHWALNRDIGDQVKTAERRTHGGLEIVTALKSGIRVVPVLIDGARMPDRRELYESMRPLASRQSARVRHETYAADVAALVEGLRGTLGWIGTYPLPFTEALRKSLLGPPGSVSVLDLAGPLSAAQLEPKQTRVEQFCGGCLLAASGGSVTAADLYRRYCVWSLEQTEEPLTMATFGRAMTNMGIKMEKIAGRSRYIGVAIRT
ncbi:MAG: hypothetical protein ABL907_10700 [Hyphomicrobium sp.]